MHFVVAGVGYTGRRVCFRLPRTALVCLNRSVVSGLPDGVTTLRLDLDHAAPEIIQLPAPCTVLYTIPPRATDEPDSRLAGFLAGLAADVHRIVYLSTTGVYGNRHGETVTEQDSPMPETDRAQRRLAAEKLLGAWCEENQTELIILRVPGIYGPGRIGRERITAGEPVIAESESSPGNRIHVDDLAACCVTAMTAPVPPGAYNVGDGDHRSSTWFSQSVAALLKLPPLPEISRAKALETFGDMRLSFLAESRIVDTSKMREVMGFTPTYTDPIDGIRVSLAE